MDSHQEREESGDATESAAPSRLKLAARYAMLGFAPAVAVVALIVAAMAVSGNRSSEEQLGKAAAATDSLSVNLAEARSELERLRLAMASDKSRREEERRKQEELEARLIRNISQLQAKAKISPTLEQQLQQPASAPADAPAAASAPAAPAAMSATTGAGKELSPQVKAMKEAIEKFNRQ